MPEAFGDGIDFAQLVKFYGTPHDEQGRATGSREVIGTMEQIVGDPDGSKINTSYVERQNLTMRMGMRRFSRLTTATPRRSRTMLPPSRCTSCT